MILSSKGNKCNYKWKLQSMLHDKKYLYIGIKAYGDPDKIRATLKNRDQTWNEDYVALMADPFRDGRYGILIGVNALGVQLDEKHISSAGPDDSWDILFQSAWNFGGVEVYPGSRMHLEMDGTLDFWLFPLRGQL